jgi:hypothetical protein
MSKFMARSVILKNFRIIDESTGMAGPVLIEDSLISAVSSRFDRQAAVCIDAEKRGRRDAGPGADGEDKQEERERGSQ